MKKLLLFPGYLMTALLAVATQPLYENNASLIAYCTSSNPPPTIDALAFVNRSVFTVGTCLGEPFEVLNLWNFTNTGSGRMYGIPGFRFDHFSGNTRQMMDSWINQGSITGETWVAVSSHNITSSGFLCTGPAGLIRLEGDTIDLKRDGIRSGETPGTTFGGGYTYLNGTNYEYNNAIGVSDLYWGAGTNNYLNNQGQPMSLNSLYWQLPCSQSPLHQVIDTRFGPRLYTNTVTVPPQFQYSYLTCSVPYTAHVYISQFGTQKSVQIVYVPIDTDPSMQTEVRFSSFFGGADAVVAFHMVDQDIVSGGAQTNSLFLVDSAMNLGTNILLARPGQFSTATGRRPINYDLVRYPPYQFINGNNANAPFDPTLLYNANSLTNRVNMQYAAYAANLSSSAGLLGGTSGVAGEPTNYPGRVEISGNEVNLDQSRIRAESTIVIRAAENLVNNKLAKVDAPFVSYDLRSLQSPLYITNLAPATVRRLGGNLFCWTALWDGLELDGLGGTNTVRFHILMVDRSIVATRPVSVYEFTAHATNLVISDSLNISRSMLLDSRNLHVTGGLALPPNWGWGASNVPVTLNFTNDGTILIPQAARYGSDRSTPYWNFINNGTNTAGSQFIRATNFVDTGSIIASSGILKVDAGNASLMGAPTTIYTNVFTNAPVFIPTNLFDGYWITNVSTNVFTNSLGAMLLANADVEIYARDLYVSNSIIQAGDTALGALVMSVTNSLVNAGPNMNKWVTTAGFRMMRQPTTGDLLYTHITSKAGPYLEVQHIWPAQDRGAIDASGYSNNLAVGQLTLDGANNTLFHFSAPAGTGQRAMYIDYLELLNNATNHTDPNTLSIDPNLTIYIANANISPRKLELTHPGRIRWVPYFAGPLSTTNLTYPSGRSYSFNCALVTDKSLDSDLDGTPNAYDETPMPEPVLSMAILPGSPARAVFSWYSPAYAINWLEAKSETTGSWSPLTRVLGGAMNGPVSVTNAMQNENLRFYRIRVEPPPLN